MRYVGSYQPIAYVQDLYTARNSGSLDESHEASEPLLSQRNGFDSIPHGGSFNIHSDGRSYSYAYGPGGLRGLLQNHYALGCTVFASIGVFLRHFSWCICLGNSFESRRAHVWL